MQSHRHSPSRARKSDAYGADPMALVDDLLDRLADRVADRIIAGLGPQREQDAWLDLASAAERLGLHPDTLRKRAKAGLVPLSRTGRDAACTSAPRTSTHGGTWAGLLRGGRISPAKPSGVRERPHSGVQV